MASVAARPPSTTQLAAADSVAFEDDKITLDEVKQINDHEEHEPSSKAHVDSMVSVRLSDTSSGRASLAKPQSTTILEESEVNVNPTDHRNSADIMHGVGLDISQPTTTSSSNLAAPSHQRNQSTAGSSVYGSDLGEIAEHSENTETLSILESSEPSLATELANTNLQADPSTDTESVIYSPEKEDNSTEEEEEDEASMFEARATSLPRSSSLGSNTGGDDQVNWEQLAEEEQQEEKDETTDESTAFLLARLEQENQALAADHRFGLKRSNQARPPSIQVLKRLVNDPNGISTRYSVLPEPPPMTELEFWAALVKDYPQTVQRLPTLTSNKIRSGVPPPLRGVVWVSMVGARDTELGDQFDKLCEERSPYESIIGKDIGRSFPGVEMFKDPFGEGQQMLARVLRAFSLYDKEIGYCQGLGFLVGPLLMQMGDKDAFCVLVKLMDNYGLRSCFRPDLSGLHLRIFQFQKLLTQHLPELAQHLASLQVEAAYLSQWFLSFFAVTCPLPMLFRIYDVIFAEGASETIMRVAMSLMKRNQEQILAHTEFEEVMQLLLSRSLWETYNCDADDLVNDFVQFTGMVTQESLQKLELQFGETSGADTLAKFAFFSDASAAASRFLGRIWTASHAKPNLLGPSGNFSSKAVRRSPSKSSIASTVQSHSEGTDSVATVGTDATAMSRESGVDVSSLHSKSGSVAPLIGVSKEDKDLHGQIEDLLTALSDMQRDQSVLAESLQKEREERAEDHQVFDELVTLLKPKEAPTSQELQVEKAVKKDRHQTLPPHALDQPPLKALSAELADIVERVDARLVSHRNLRRSSMLETKAHLREQISRSKDQLTVETSRSADLSRRLDALERENSGLHDLLRDARGRISDSFADRNRLKRTIQELRANQRSSVVWSESDQSPVLWRSDSMDSRASITSLATGSRPATPSIKTSSTGGLRELKLGRTSVAGPSPSSHVPQSSTGSFHPPRGASLATKQILSTKDHQPASEEDMLIELVNAKTAEAQAKHELEELRSKFDAMRRMLGMPTPPTLGQSPGNTPGNSAAASAAAAFNNLSTSMSSFFHRPSASDVTVVPNQNQDQEKLQASGGTSEASSISNTPTRSNSQASNDKLSPPPSGGPATAAAGFWSAWGKRSASQSQQTVPSDIKQSVAGGPGPSEKTNSS